MYLWEQINNHSNSVNTIMSDSLVLIPTYNEKENIENIIRAVFALPKSFHILVIDDNSPDGTADIVKRLQVEFSTQLHLLERKAKNGLDRKSVV